MKPAKIRTRLPIALLTLSLLATASNAGEVPAWRPLNGNNVIPAGDYPVTWSATENVAWKIDLPEAGNSTPVVVGDRIFVTQAITEG